MTKYVVVALTCVALAGCTTTGQNYAQLSDAVGAKLAASDAEIARVAAKVGTTPCSVFSTAVQYFNALQPLIPAEVQASGLVAITTGTALCAGTTTGVPSALAKLSQVWLALQVATKAPAK